VLCDQTGGKAIFNLEQINKVDLHKATEDVSCFLGKALGSPRCKLSAQAHKADQNKFSLSAKDSHEELRIIVSKEVDLLLPWTPYGIYGKAWTARLESLLPGGNLF